MNTEQFEQLEFTSFAERVAEVSKTVYNDFLNKIQELCLESARKGDVFLVLDKTWKGNGDNADVLINYLNNKGFKTSIENNQIVIRWKHLLVTDKPVTDKPVTDKPVTDKPVTDKPVINENIDIVAYIQEKLKECDGAIGKENKAKISFEIFDTIVKTEEQYPKNCDKLFKTEKFFNTMVKKLDEFESDPDTIKYVPWVPEIKKSIRRIGENRGFIKDHDMVEIKKEDVSEIDVSEIPY